ncbi:hypothetical protein GYH30_057157 [Glycine max]|nr:hypothetical protein GYH30_057157 [Glycine max]
MSPKTFSTRLPLRSLTFSPPWPSPGRHSGNPRRLHEQRELGPTSGTHSFPSSNPLLSRFSSSSQAAATPASPSTSTTSATPPSPTLTSPRSSSPICSAATFTTVPSCDGASWT